MAILASAKTFEPLLAFFRYLAAWSFVVTFILTWFSGIRILSIVSLVLTFFGFVLNLTVAIIDQKAKKRLVNNSIPLPRYSLAVLIIDWIFFVLVLGWSGLYIYAMSSTGVSWYIQIIAAHAYMGVLVGWHFQLFFAIVGLKLRKQYGSHRQAERDRHTYDAEDAPADIPLPSYNGSTVSGFSTVKVPDQK